MSKKYNIFQNTPEWHELRSTRIGGSDAATVMGKNPWKTPLTLWKEKMGIIDAPFVTEAMMRGTMLEDKARKEFILLTGIPMEPEVFYNDWQIASLDGYNKQQRLILEIKCPNKETHEMAKQGIIPEYYNIQMQHQFLLSETNNGFYFSFDGEKGVIVDVERDNGIIAEMLVAEMDFYRRMKEFDPPEGAYEIRMDEDWKMAAEKMRHAKELKKQAEALEEEAKAELIAKAHADKCEGFGVRLYRSIVKGVVQYKKIPELKGVDLDQFRGPPSERWTVSLV